jgi:hypothetical protein
MRHAAPQASGTRLKWLGGSAGAIPRPQEVMNMMSSRTTRLWVVAVFCAGIALGQTVKGVANIKVILGKQPGASAVILSPSPTGGITGQLPNRVPSGTSFVVLDQQGNIVTAAAVNAADGTFQLPPRIPLQANFTSCLEVPGAARICSDPGAMAAVVNMRQTAGALTTAPGGPVGGPGPRTACPSGTSWNGTQCVGAQPNPAMSILPADAAVLANIQINRAPGGNWRCTGKAGACSPTEVQTLARVVTVTIKGVSNIEALLVVAPDGTIGCKDSTEGRPCTYAEVNDFASLLKTRHDTVKNSIGNVR